MTQPMPIDRLLRWLDSDPDQLTRHLERYPADEDRLDAFTALDDGARGLLDRALSPPMALLEEIHRRLTPDPATTEALAVFGDLLGLGLRTGSLLFGPVLRTRHDQGVDVSDDASGDVSGGADG